MSSSGQLDGKAQLFSLEERRGKQWVFTSKGQSSLLGNNLTPRGQNFAPGVKIKTASAPFQHLVDMFA
jgi:hypothetical protein